MSKGGFSQIVLMDKGTLDTSPTNPIAFGITRNSELIVSPIAFKSTKIEHKDWEISNFDNFALKGESIQPSIFMFKKLLDWVNGNCDAQIVSKKQGSAATSTDVFLFDDGRELGIDFRFIVSDEVRYCGIDLERAFPKGVFDTIIAAALTDTAIVISEGDDFDKVRTPYPLTTDSPSATALFTTYTKRMLTIESKMKRKDINNISLIDDFKITLEIEGEEASIAQFIAQRAKGLSSDVVFTEGNAGAYFDKWVFNDNVLVQNSIYTINEKERIMNVKYVGTVPKEAFAFGYGTSNGGAANDSTGTTGGTVTVG
jgi:hypothetical protein